MTGESRASTAWRFCSRLCAFADVTKYPYSYIVTVKLLASTTYMLDWCMVPNYQGRPLMSLHVVFTIYKFSHMMIYPIHHSATRPPSTRSCSYLGLAVAGRKEFRLLTSMGALRRHTGCPRSSPSSGAQWAPPRHGPLDHTQPCVLSS